MNSFTHQETVMVCTAFRDKQTVYVIPDYVNKSNILSLNRDGAIRCVEPERYAGIRPFSRVLRLVRDEVTMMTMEKELDAILGRLQR